MSVLLKYTDDVLFKAIINAKDIQFVLFRTYVIHSNICGVIVWCPPYCIGKFRYSVFSFCFNCLECKFTRLYHFEERLS